MAERRRYTRKTKASAVITAEMTSVLAASEATGIPRTTIGYWVEQPEFVILRQKTREELAAGSILLAHLAQAELTKKIRAGEVEPRDLATIYGIAIDSEIGKGSTFRIWLPSFQESVPSPTAAGAAEASAAVVAALPTSPAAPVSRRPCILMVEDDAAIRQTTRILLCSLGAETLTAGSKREALALFKKHTDAINLLLLDAQIDSLDNVRLLASLRVRKPGVPSIIVSGHTEKRIREVFASEPFDGFLSKPYTTVDLWNALYPFITLKRPASANRPASHT